MRSGSTIELISTILPPETVKPMTATDCPPRVMTTPAARSPAPGASARRSTRSRASGARRLPHRAAPRKGQGPRPCVDPGHHVRVEDRDERVEVAAVRRGEERVDHLDPGANHIAATPRRRALSAGLTVRLWDLHSLTPLASFTIEDFPEVCALTADGETVIVGDYPAHPPIHRRATAMKGRPG